MDNEPFWKLLKPVHTKAAAFCRKLAGDRDDGDDLYQDALVLALTRFKSLDNHAAFKSWLFRIIVNRFKNRQRSFWLRRRVALTAAVLDTAAGSDPIGSAAARRLLDGLLEMLSPEDRAIIVLHEIEGWPVADIASTLGKPQGTIKTRLFRARLKMRRGLERHMVRCGSDRVSEEITYAMQRCKTVDN